MTPFCVTRFRNSILWLENSELLIREGILNILHVWRHYFVAAKGIAAAAHRISRTNSGCRVEWQTAGKV